MACSPPNAVSGRMRRIKDVVACILLAVFVFPPFLRWDRGPGEPAQAILCDIPGRRLLVFGAEFIMRDMPIVLSALIGATALLFLVSAIAGRIWCGFACPQTLWVDIFYRVERFMKRHVHGNPMLVEHASRFVQLLISVVTAFFFLCWFQDSWSLAGLLLSGAAPAADYVSIATGAGLTMLLGVYTRERFCINMCPWPRFQVAFVDDDSLVVTYDSGRGEPRGKKRIPLRPDLLRPDPLTLLAEGGSPAPAGVMTRDMIAMAAMEGGMRGDCIDCSRCVTVCPTNVDIRKGLQIGCIGCGLCVDACNGVMDKIGRPQSLIRFSTESGLKPKSYFRAKTLVFAAVALIAFGAGGYAVTHHDNTEFSLESDRTPIALANGDLRNDYQLHLTLHGNSSVRVRIEAVGLPGLKPRIAGTEGASVEADPDEDVQERLVVTAPAADHLQGRTPFVFRLVNDETGQVIAVRQNFFWAPGSAGQ
jgi:polyferredoxin